MGIVVYIVWNVEQNLHGDNIAFRVPGLKSITAHGSMEEFNDPKAMVILPRYHQFTNGNSRPKYLAELMDMLGFVRPIVRVAGSENLCTVIIDFGSGKHVNYHAVPGFDHSLG